MDSTEIQNAADILSHVTQLAQVQAEANRLKELELTILGQDAKNKATELDLQAQSVAIERERLNRFEARIHETLMRLTEATAKMITIDDTFGETVQRVINTQRVIINALIDLEKAVLALLSQNSFDIREARRKSPQQIDNHRKQELLLEHQNTLHNLLLQQASYGSIDTPPKITRQIEQIQQIIADLEQELRQQ